MIAAFIFCLLPLTFFVFCFFKRNRVADREAALAKINAMDLVTSVGGISKEEGKKKGVDDAIPFEMAAQDSNHSIGDTPDKDGDEILSGNEMNDKSLRKTTGLVGVKAKNNKFLPDIHSNKTKSFVPFQSHMSNFYNGSAAGDQSVNASTTDHPKSQKLIEMEEQIKHKKGQEKRKLLADIEI